MAADILERIVGADHVLREAGDTAPFLVDFTGKRRGAACAVVLPRTADEVAAVVRAAITHGLHIVPQGGNTGLAGGAAPGDPDKAILLSLKRMNAIREIAPGHITAEAGCILATLQEAADADGQLLPLALGAEGSCTLGGIVSTNAGGVRTLRYGNCRDLVLGLEAVLPNGERLAGPNTLRKNNSGYDLRHLLIGAEGTLGIVTAATLRLVPAWRQCEVAFVALDKPAAGMALLDRLQRTLGDVVVACELIQKLALDLSLGALAGSRSPLTAASPWYLLVEIASGGGEDDLAARFEAALADAIGDGLAQDAVLAPSLTARRDFWRLREGIVEGQRAAGFSLKFDISVPVARVPEFIRRGEALVADALPDARPLSFGHVGDGNIHFSILTPAGGAPGRLEPLAGRLTDEVHALALSLGGSISAEHGIGRAKSGALPGAVGATAFDMMRAIKRAIDPANLFNPGAVLAAEEVQRP
jgi:FAD/FMN-containing dehydrogenase